MMPRSGSRRDRTTHQEARVPRIAEARQPAEPTSVEQKDRYRRILRAASRLGAEHGLERVQMLDVAKEAGVAIATLYRYFPSKTAMFVAVLHSQVERLSETAVSRPEPGQRANRVAEVLIVASRRMLERPLLATAMLQANNSAQLQFGQEFTDANEAFHGLLLRCLGVEDPVEEDLRMIRIVEQTWYGILVSTLNDVITLEQSCEDIRLAARLLLGPTYDAEATG
jgi:AcrR family transcriptional regulator